jgi:hypothetical protein
MNLPKIGLPGEAAHLIRWTAKGKILKPQTIKQHRSRLANYSLPTFGKIKFGKITPTAVEDFLLKRLLSSSCRNTIMYTLKLIMIEARRTGIIGICMFPAFP